MGTPTGLAMGVPAEWIPMDFGLFSMPTPQYQMAGLNAASAAPVLPPDDASFNLLFCNQDSHAPVMATAQMGLPPDLDVKLDFDEDFDEVLFGGGFSNHGDMIADFDDTNLELSPLPELLGIRESNANHAGAPSSTATHTAQQMGQLDLQDQSLAATMKQELEPSTLGGVGGLLLDAENQHCDPLQGSEADFLVHSGPIWEPLSTPIEQSGPFFRKVGGAANDILGADQVFVTSGQEVSGKDNV